MNNRMQRQQAILGIVREGDVRTQSDLAARLRAAGYECTQATVSRDIAELGLVKPEGGTYAAAADERLARMVSQLVEGVSHAGNLVVVHTYAGAAAGVAGAIDEAALAGALGCVAGDDTILLAADSEDSAATIAKRLQSLQR